MKALSICQPWAWVILHAGKDVENRTWPAGYRGRLAVHASKTATYLDSDIGWIQSEHGVLVPREELAFGALVGTVSLVDCTRRSSSPWANEGCWHWVLADPEPLPEPIPFKGRLGLFELPAGLLERKSR